MSSIAVDPHPLDGAVITIKLDPQTLIVQADTVSALARIIGAETIDIDARGVGIAVAERILRSNIDNPFTVVYHTLGLPS